MSNQMKSWINKWAWGKISAADIVQEARAFAKDGQKDVFVSRLLKGTGSISNAERVVGTLISTGLVSSTHVPDSSVEEIILPSDMFAWIEATNPRLFNVRLGAKSSGVQEWWEQLRASPQGKEFWEGHPWLKRRTPAELRYHLPLVMHEDAGPISHVHSAYIRSWSSILCCGKEIDTRLVICTYLKDALKNDDDASWPLILESFRTLAQPQPPGKWGGVAL